MNSTLCHGVTLKGVSCTKRTKDPSHLCYLHRKKPSNPVKIVQQPSEPKKKAVSDPVEIEKDECCVCYEFMPVSDALGCKHLVCKVCIPKMRDDRCPMCRTQIKTLSVKTMAEIQRRRQQDREERFRLATQQLLIGYPVQQISIRNPRVRNPRVGV